ncbi:hypothetical protein IQ273_24435 [Nodosilinea sp. LEGE 07298]|uniref:hypothetical protein n=1 Tax=Nodosilinea sp. LEGE 07298 TaxID=2777970 RepID=UPI00187EBFD5|nr:hypothetical protein [Nodosilinea sp. LEGE 07298]MBE9112546.1 hypothetical protein [Nodosilinea sp. LEGE 07298]
MVLKSLVIWLMFILVESLNGTARILWLVPALGNGLAHQVSFAIGSVLILTMATVLGPWLQASWVQRLPIFGADRLVDGRGNMRWKLQGLLPMMQASGTDVTH